MVANPKRLFWGFDAALPPAQFSKNLRRSEKSQTQKTAFSNAYSISENALTVGLYDSLCRRLPA
jgi:hypothetical protein